MRGLILGLLVAGCGAEANHIGNPLTWPGAAIRAGLGNAAYAARRDRVAAHVATHQAQILDEAQILAEAQAGAGGTVGAALAAAMDLAAVPDARRAALLSEIARGAAQYATDAEALVVAIMVHGP